MLPTAIFDHSKAVKDLLRMGIDVYCSMPTAEEIGVFHDHRCRIIYRDKAYQIGSFFVRAFATVHDGKCESDWNTLGFYVRSTMTSECLVFCTDSAYIRPRFKRIDRLLIECNYSEPAITEILQSGRISQAQYNRILATHMGLDQCVGFLKANDLSHLKSIHLLHLSNGNSDEELILKTIRGLTGVPVVACSE